MKTTSGIELIRYIETPRSFTNPVKIDAILKARMKAFLHARRVQCRISSK
jgi:hypothetical protein